MFMLRRNSLLILEDWRSLLTWLSLCCIDIINAFLLRQANALKLQLKALSSSQSLSLSPCSQLKTNDYPVRSLKQRGISLNIVVLFSVNEWTHRLHNPQWRIKHEKYCTFSFSQDSSNKPPHVPLVIKMSWLNIKLSELWTCFRKRVSKKEW